MLNRCCMVTGIDDLFGVLLEATYTVVEVYLGVLCI